MLIALARLRWQSESDVKREVQKLRERIYDAYAESVGLDAQACYLHGTPLRPVVPLDVAQGGLFVIGTYPSARFHLIDGVNDVPRRRQSRTFRERTLTDLVKVFLFKDGHRRKYTELNATAPIGYERERFDELALRSLPLLERELRLAKPRLVVTLGMDVAGALTGRRSAGAQRQLLAPRVVPLDVGGSSFSAMHCAHPGF